PPKPVNPAIIFPLFSSCGFTFLLAIWCAVYRLPCSRQAVISTLPHQNTVYITMCLYTVF
uniref:hypothetical protein n=1 Tax=Enterobacter hormaechei TaxID=158836 RepID=UPI003F4961B8